MRVVQAAMVEAGCWANTQGGCAGGLSGEHVLTSSLWRGPAVTIRGLPWCPDWKTIGVASLTANILCRHHNSELSTIDTSATAAFTAMRDAENLFERRRKQAAQRWRVKQYDIEGIALERWATKTLVNVVVSSSSEDGRWAVGEQPLASPPPCIVEAAFGLSRLQGPMGLYGLASIGEQVPSGDAIRIVPLNDDLGALVGCELTFRGFRFLLNLQPLPIAQAPMFVSVDGSSSPAGEPIHHLKAINVNVHKHRSHVIGFTW